MRPLLPTRLSMLLLLAVPLCAQSKNHSRTAQQPPVLPATPPTDVPAVPPPPPTPAQSPASRANVSYTASQLTISASNSSLNQILREVSRLTGIKVTGGVAEERVFGDYGPGEPADVLGKLLDGTGSNMLFVSSVDGKTPELILTPRTVGVTPPNPNASRFDDNADAEDESRQQVTPAPQPSESQSQPARPNPVATPIQPAQAAGDANAQSPQPTTAPADPSQSPNGVKTPQQIYDELMRLRRQQQTQPQ